MLGESDGSRHVHVHSPYRIVNFRPAVVLTSVLALVLLLFALDLEESNTNIDLGWRFYRVTSFQTPLRFYHSNGNQVLLNPFWNSQSGLSLHCFHSLRQDLQSTGFHNHEVQMPAGSTILNARKGSSRCLAVLAAYTPDFA